MDAHFSQKPENNTRISQEILVFQGRQAPETGILVGYGALIGHYGLQLPLPATLAIIGARHRQYNVDGWRVLGPRFQPADTLSGHLTFALKYEGVHLLLFKKIFETLGATPITELIQEAPTGQYSRRIWALYEWQMEEQLPMPALHTKSYIMLADANLQYVLENRDKMERQRVMNNLPGTRDFCPMISRTSQLDKHLNTDYASELKGILQGAGRDLLQRTAAFLQLKDSKASFTIEGEKPGANRAIRWGRTLGEAGTRPLSHEELLRLQQLVIENPRFLRLGYREEGGFIGGHDRITNEPIPDHISARHEDLQRLMDGLLSASRRMENAHYPPVLAAAAIAFGFVFIHPFVDGNGRIHRYLIHHMLATGHFSPQSLLFPVSAAILERLQDYRRVLEHFSHPLLEQIEWQQTDNNNVRVLNDTADYYRYFDATPQAEFLYDCIAYTVGQLIPEEVAYLQRRDSLLQWLGEHFEMPDRMSSLLAAFLEQGAGQFSKRARQKELAELSDKEVESIEAFYATLKP